MHFVETIIAYLRHAARSTRPPPPYQQIHQLIIHLLLWDDNAEITTVACEWKGWQRGKGWRRAEGMPRGRDGGRAERAACRRYAIVVSPTQLVPEVLAVWGSD